MTYRHNEWRTPHPNTREEPSGVKQARHCSEADHEPASGEWYGCKHEGDFTAEEIYHPSAKRTSKHGADIEKRLVRETNEKD